jgi:hypothetical protein
LHTTLRNYISNLTPAISNVFLNSALLAPPTTQLHL